MPSRRASHLLQSHAQGGQTPCSVSDGGSAAGSSPTKGVKGLLQAVDSRVDRAFDRMEGVSKELVNRLARPLGGQLDKRSPLGTFTQVPTDYGDD